MTVLPAIRNGRGERLDAALHLPHPGSPEAAPADLVLIGHGVTGSKDRPWLEALGDALAAAGLAALRFSFAGNGDSEGRFEEATLAKEVGDLGSVLDAVTAWGVGRLAYAGHSMGGAIGVLRAADDPRIASLVSLAGMVHVHAFMKRQFGHLQLGDPMLDKPGCPWTRSLADDAARIGSVLPQAARLEIPWLLVHGDADELVPLADAFDARAAAGGRPDLVVLPGVDHRFTGAVPQLVDAVVPWLLRHLRRTA
ncbi:MAG TPA: alpha/beta fold hydrolase [Methylomirabilota bacterium]